MKITRICSKQNDGDAVVLSAEIDIRFQLRTDFDRLAACIGEGGKFLSAHKMANHPGALTLGTQLLAGGLESSALAGGAVSVDDLEGAAARAFCKADFLAQAHRGFGSQRKILFEVDSFADQDGHSFREQRSHNV